MPEWKPLPFRLWEDLATWLKREEWRHLHFSSRIKKALGRKSVTIPQDHCLVCTGPRGEILGACLLSYNGIILPAFQPGVDPEILAESLRPHLERRPLFSIVGSADRTTSLARTIPQHPKTVIAYLLMTGPEKVRDFTPRISQGTIHRATRSDIRRLMPLELAYQKEEVLLNPQEVDPSSIRCNLAVQIKEQAVFFLEENGTVTAKGGTNASGFHFVQLGGVFTRPELRGQGRGLTLVSHIVEWALSAGYRSALFVKKDNRPAVALYRRLGFIEREDFNIHYYY